MLSIHSGSLEVSAAVQMPRDQCSAVNDRVVGLAVCSLSSAPHSTHLLLCEETGEPMGTWTDADPTFRVPTDGSKVMPGVRSRVFGDAA